MKIQSKKSYLHIGTILLSGAAIMLGTTSISTNANAQNNRPALIITDDPLPAELKSRVYNHPIQGPQIDANQVSGSTYYNDGMETVVGRKINELRDEFFILQSTVADLAERLAYIEQEGQNLSASYYADIATIYTQLQIGTTPGNPRLVEKLTNARSSVETLGDNIANLNNIAVEVTQSASMAAFLLESTEAAYTLSGAIEEDHIKLAQLEDAISSIVVVIDRMLKNVNDDITRTVTYLNTERDNLRTLSMAINSGDLFGRSLSRRLYSNAAPANPKQVTSLGQHAPVSYQVQREGQPYNPDLSESRPLVKIRFDRSNVAYEQPLYQAVNEAMGRYPNARFALVAVHPSKGNAAQVAIESTKARRNAEKVLRSLSQMGLSMEQINLSYAPSDNVPSNEVHLYIQ
jgi:hypothetical protein